MTPQGYEVALTDIERRAHRLRALWVYHYVRRNRILNREALEPGFIRRDRWRAWRDLVDSLEEQP